MACSQAVVLGRSSIGGLGYTFIIFHILTLYIEMMMRIVECIDGTFGMF